MSNKDQQQVSAIVADGRTIFSGKGRFVPGDKFTGPASEVKKLQALGYLEGGPTRIVPITGVRGGLMRVRNSARI